MDETLLILDETSCTPRQQGRKLWTKPVVILAEPASETEGIGGGSHETANIFS